MADSLVKICPISEVAENSAKSFEVGNNVIAVYNIGGTFYATDNECTHAAASLADGILEDDIIECALHFGAFAEHPLDGGAQRLGAVNHEHIAPLGVQPARHQVFQQGLDHHGVLRRALP